MSSNSSSEIDTTKALQDSVISSSTTVFLSNYAMDNENSQEGESASQSQQAESSEPEDDYMSDAFLNACQPAPGVPKRKQDQREFNMYKKKLKTEETKKEHSEVSLREKGLKTAISADNKGFQMLAKMGFKLGTSLGKTNEGLIEPIPIDLRKDNAGLGRSDSVVSSQCTGLNSEEVEKALDAYQKACASNYKTRVMSGYFFKAQKVCAKLDKAAGLAEPLSIFYWPKEELDIDSESDDDIDEDDEEEAECQYSETNLTELNTYLRNEHLYCAFCCTRFTDRTEMDEICPGSSFDDHPE